MNHESRITNVDTTVPRTIVSAHGTKTKKKSKSSLARLKLLIGVCKTENTDTGKLTANRESSIDVQLSCLARYIVSREP